MSKDPYQLVRLSINPKHNTEPGLEIDGSKYAPNTLFVVDPFEYPSYDHTRLVRGIKNVEYPNGGFARVRHFTHLRPWAGIWLLGNGRDLTPTSHEAGLIDPDGWFMTTQLQIQGAPNDQTPDVWPGPSIRAINFKDGQQLSCHVLKAPGEILVYENSGQAEYSVSGSANDILCHGDRPAVVAKDCKKASTVRLNGVLSEGGGFRPIRCDVAQTVWGAGRGGKYLGDGGFIYSSGFGNNSHGKVNVCMDFIGRLSGGIDAWEEGLQTSAVYFDNFGNNNVVQDGVVMYGFHIGVNIGGGYRNKIGACRYVGIPRPVVDEDRSHFQQRKAWDVPLPDPRKNVIKAPSSSEAHPWIFMYPQFAKSDPVVL